MMKVSILVPVYKAEAYIEHCARSLFEQSYNNIEFVFVNDCTPDNSVYVLEETIKDYPWLAGRIIVVNNTENMGIAKVRNLLLEYASGDYVFFVDSDDYIDLNAVKLFVETAEKDNADIVRCDYYLVKDGKNSIVRNVRFKSKDQLLEDTIGHLSGVDSVWQLFIKREIFKKNELSFLLGVNICEDYIMSVKLFYYASTVVDICVPLYYYVADNGNSITKSTQLVVEDRLKAVVLVEKFLKEKQILDKFKKALFLRTLISKQGFLLNKNCLDIERYLSVIPESNKIWRCFSYSRRERFLFWLAEHRCRMLIKLFYSFS